MTDDDADGDVAPGRPDHPARDPGGKPTPDEADERYLTGERDEGSEEPAVDDAVARGNVFTRILDRVPEWVADLGAGCLLASTLATFIVTAFAVYFLVSGRYVQFDIAASRLVTMAVVFSLATVFQAVSVRWARQRVRWMWVMLATAMGMLSVAGTLFALPAAACLFLSKRHFAMSTPVGLMGDGEDEAEEADAS